MRFSNAQAIIYHSQEVGIYLMAQGNQLIVDAPKGYLSEELRQCLAKNKIQILEALTYHGHTLAELKEQAEADWESIKNDPNALSAFAQILSERKLMHEGSIPKRFTSTSFCKSCKRSVAVPPALANGGQLLGCMWCSLKSNSTH